MVRVANRYSKILGITIDVVLAVAADQGWSQFKIFNDKKHGHSHNPRSIPPPPPNLSLSTNQKVILQFVGKQLELHKAAKLSGKIAAVPKVLRNGKELSRSPMVILPRSKEALETYDCKRKTCTA